MRRPCLPSLLPSPPPGPLLSPAEYFIDLWEFVICQPTFCPLGETATQTPNQALLQGQEFP